MKLMRVNQRGLCRIVADARFGGAQVGSYLAEDDAVRFKDRKERM